MPASKKKKGTSKKKQDPNGETEVIEVLEVLEVIDVIDDPGSSTPGDGDENNLPVEASQLDPATKAGKELEKTAMRWIKRFSGNDRLPVDEFLQDKALALPVTVIRGIGVTTGRKLGEGGVHDIQEFLDRKDTSTLARALGVSPEKVLAWQQDAGRLLKAGLAVLPGLGKVYCSRLNAAGLLEPCQLTTLHPRELVKITGAREKTVVGWIEAAKKICGSTSNSSGRSS